jgi:predicted RNA methylase
MKLKQLQALLEDVEPFAKPKVALEQYVTGAARGSAVLADTAEAC